MDDDDPRCAGSRRATDAHVQLSVHRGRQEGARSHRPVARHAPRCRRSDADLCGRRSARGQVDGGRVASHLVGDEGVAVAGLVYYGYPLVPLGTGTPRATEHLARIGAAQLFFAGSRDRLSPPDLMGPIVAGLPNGRLVVVDDGDHSLNVPQRSGRTQGDVLAAAASETVACGSRTAALRRREGPTAELRGEGGRSDRRQPDPWSGRAPTPMPSSRRAVVGVRRPQRRADRRCPR